MLKLVLLLSIVSLGIADEVCPKSYWGEGCVNYCGFCAYTGGKVDAGDYNRECNAVDGSCAHSYGCQTGYTGEKCDTPICDDCESGECVAPGLCQNCIDINHVSPNCLNLKLRGVLGSLMAIIVLILSLIGCAFGSMVYQRKKNAHFHLN